MKKNNILRDLIDEGKPTIGTHVHTVWPGIAEVIGYSGTIDYVEFTSQYAPYDLFSLDNFARAIELFDHMTSMIKVDQEPRTYLAEKATGSGIQNLLFADIRTVDDALGVGPSGAAGDAVGRGHRGGDEHAGHGLRVSRRVAGRLGEDG